MAIVFVFILPLYVVVGLCIGNGKEFLDKYDDFSKLNSILGLVHPILSNGVFLRM